MKNLLELLENPIYKLLIIDLEEELDELKRNFISAHTNLGVGIPQLRDDIRYESAGEIKALEVLLLKLKDPTIVVGNLED